MSRLARPSKVYALDLDAGLIEQARRHVAERGKADLVAFAADDAMRVTCHVPEPIGFVLLANTLHDVPDKAGFAREVGKVLAPGGKFAVVNWYPAPREQTLVLGVPRGPSTEMRISPRQTGESVEPAGFALERVVDLPPTITGRSSHAVDNAGGASHKPPSPRTPEDTRSYPLWCAGAHVAEPGGVDGPRL
jgi:SAM-dependent methyltransferase